MVPNEWRRWVLAAVALTTYIIGGLALMAGLVMIGFLGSKNLWGLGEARSIGYLFFLVGACLSIFGVLIMRIMRNRF